MKITDQFAAGMNAEADSIVKRLWATQELMEKRALQLVDASNTYEAAYHKEFLLAKVQSGEDRVSDRVAEAHAKTKTASLHFAMDRAEALHKAAVSAMHNLRAELDTWRSKAANLKAEAEVVRAGVV